MLDISNNGRRTGLNPCPKYSYLYKILLLLSSSGVYWSSSFKGNEESLFLMTKFSVFTSTLFSAVFSTVVLLTVVNSVSLVQAASKGGETMRVKVQSV